jgi:hypothetical protein
MWNILTHVQNITAAAQDGTALLPLKQNSMIEEL